MSPLWIFAILASLFAFAIAANRLSWWLYTRHNNAPGRLDLTTAPTTISPTLAIQRDCDGDIVVMELTNGTVSESVYITPDEMRLVLSWLGKHGY